MTIVVKISAPSLMAINQSVSPLLFGGIHVQRGNKSFCARRSPFCAFWKGSGRGNTKYRFSIATLKMGVRG